MNVNAFPPLTTPPPLLQSIPAPLPATKSIDDALKIRGGNCHGSLWCTLYDGRFIQTAYHLATTGYPGTTSPGPGWNTGPMNDTAFYAQGAHAVCVPTAASFSPAGFCVFASSVGKRGRRRRGGDDDEP
ncbi:MAG: hypothetical protein LQ346_008881, partial [Caloplaca aetnensis]